MHSWLEVFCTSSYKTQTTYTNGNIASDGIISLSWKNPVTALHAKITSHLQRFFVHFGGRKKWF